MKTVTLYNYRILLTNDGLSKEVRKFLCVCTGKNYMFQKWTVENEKAGFSMPHRNRIKIADLNVVLGSGESHGYIARSIYYLAENEECSKVKLDNNITVTIERIWQSANHLRELWKDK